MVFANHGESFWWADFISELVYGSNTLEFETLKFACYECAISWNLSPKYDGEAEVFELSPFWRTCTYWTLSLRLSVIVSELSKCAISCMWPPFLTLSRRSLYCFSIDLSCCSMTWKFRRLTMKMIEYGKSSVKMAPPISNADILKLVPHNHKAFLPPLIITISAILRITIQK